MDTDSPRLPPAPTWIAEPKSSAATEPPPAPAVRSAPVAQSTPVDGIAAKVARDADLSSHPSVLAYHAFASEQAIRDEFVGVDTGQRLLPSNRLELLKAPELGLPMVRVWAAYAGGPEPPNEKIVAWWCTAEPKLAGRRARAFHRDYGHGYAHVFVRYLLRIGEDLAAGFVEQGAKLPGMAGMYDIQAEGIAPPGLPYSPGLPFNPFALWEARLWHGMLDARGVPLGIYYYGVRTPRTNANVPGMPASPGKFYGMGTPNGVPMTSGFLVPGRWHCIEQEVKLNTVVDASLRVPVSSELDAQMREMLANANEDGELRVWLDGVLVYESTQVAFRGLDCVRIQSIPWVNIYQGGRGRYPKAPEHYDLAAMVAATEYVGPPVPTREPRVAVRASKQTLGALAASMQPGTWAELIAEDIDAVVGAGRSGGAENAIPYANSVPWCPIRKRIVFVGGDHGDGPARHIEYDDAMNRWQLIDRDIGSHVYQHVAVDPYSGDIYQRYAGDLYRYTGQGWVSVGTIPSDVSQVASVALAWWSGPYPNAGGHGVLTVYNGNGSAISAFDPTRGAWLADLREVLPGQRGQYHVVSAYSAKHNCLVYGGGNLSQGANPVERQIWRIDAELRQTRMPDAPHPIGVNHGMNLVSDSASGNVIALGFGEAWQLDPSGAGRWTRMTGPRAPPLGLLSPNVSPNCLVSCDVSTYGVVAYVDALGSRKPKCRMWVYKSA